VQFGVHDEGLQAKTPCKYQLLVCRC
jgi:hypothetical protein